MLFLQIKNFFFASISVNKIFQIIVAVSNLESNLETFEDIGKVCSKVVLFFIIGNYVGSVRLENRSK